MTLGFMTLVIAEYVYLLTSTEDIHQILIPYVNSDLSHLIFVDNGYIFWYLFFEKSAGEAGIVV